MRAFYTHLPSFPGPEPPVPYGCIIRKLIYSSAEREQVDSPDRNNMRTSINWVAVGSIAGVIAAIAAVIAVLNSNGHSAGPIPVSSASTGSKTGSPTTPPSATVGGKGGAPAIYHSGQLTLAYATCADLDAPPSDRQWGEVSIDASSGSIDLCSQSPDFVGAGGATIVTVNSGTDTTCQNATGWLRQNYYQDLNLSVGVSYACTPTKIVTRCCVLALLIPLLPQ